MDQSLNFDAILDAIIFAVIKHQGQNRKDQQGSPYVTHPLTVARLIFSVGQVQQQTILIAAVLHDTIEDTPTKPGEISQQFGEEVLNLVLEVSDDKSLLKDCRKQLQVRHANQLSSSAKIIKLADKLANCKDVLNSPPIDWPLQRRRDYIQWSADVIAQMRDTNAPLEAAFDQLLMEAEIKLDFQIEPFQTVNNRPWGPQAEDQCASKE